MESEHIRAAIEAIERELEELIREVPDETWSSLAQMGQAISQLKLTAGLEDAGYEVMPGIVLGRTEPKPEAKEPTRKIFDDTFFGQSASDAAKKYLRIGGRAKSIDEIYETLMMGGFQIKGKDKRRTLYNALVKNTAEFVLVKKSTFGLREFYPHLKEGKKRGRRPKEEGGPEESQAAQEEELETP